MSYREFTLTDVEAKGRVREIFDEIKAALGVPQVNVIFQAYAAYPAFLDLYWQSVKAAVETQEFFLLADRLRGDAYTRVHNYFAVPDLCGRVSDLSFSSGAKHELTDVVELFHYNNPPLLLLSAIVMRAVEDSGAVAHAGHRPAKHPIFEDKPILVQEDAAPPATRKIFDDIKRTLGLSVLNSDYRAFARWPDFLDVYWTALKPITQSPLYERYCEEMKEFAFNLTSELPERVQLSIAQMEEAGINEDDISAVLQLTDRFTEVLSALVLNVAFAKISLEGGNQKQQSEKVEVAA